VNLSTYDPDNISQNKLSSSAEQGGDHFYFDVPNTLFEIQTASSWKALSSESQSKLKLEKIHDYRPETGLVNDNFPFILKASNGSALQYDELINSPACPTLQLINNGTV